MRYTKFTIENYKGIQNLEIDLNRQPNSKIITLVGLNESGKTSILEAINTFSVGISENESHKLIPKKSKSNFNGSVKIIAEIAVTREDNVLLQTFISNSIKKLKPLDNFSITREYSFESSKFIEFNSSHQIDFFGIPINKTEFEEITDENWLNLINFIETDLLPKILYYPNFLFDFPNKVFLNEGESIKNKQIEFRNIIQDILTSIDPDLKIESHLIDRLNDKTSGNNEALELTLTKMSAEVSKVVLGAWKDIINIKGKEIVIEAKTTNPSTLEVKQNVLNNIDNKPSHYLEFKLKEGTEKFFISERSLGFKWFFTFLLFTEFRKNRKSEMGETIFLLDEPASNLHSTAQTKLLSKFSDLVSKCKLIYTTHSHYLINPKWLSGTLIVKNQGLDFSKDFEFNSSGTDIKAIPYSSFVSQYPNQTDYFQPILDTLDFRPGLLDKIPKIILTEGKFDYYILKYVNEILLGHKFKGLRLYPGNGADSNDQVIRLYLAWDRDFKILLDGDEAGKKAKTRYLKIFDQSISKNLIPFTDIDDSYNIPIEELFTEEEKLKITQLFDRQSKEFNKSKFNTSIQNLLFNKEKITLSDQTKEKFLKILNFISKS
jgi:predicted ATP-dependent endonuclease of OLD family